MSRAPLRPPPSLPAQCNFDDGTVSFTPSQPGAPVATVVQPDIAACSAIIHVIDQVQPSGPALAAC